MSALGLTSRAILGELYFRLNTGPDSWVNTLAYPIVSDQASEEHRWLGMVPQLREWVGGRVPHGLREQGFTIVNKDYEATIEVLTSELRRDKTGQVMRRIADLALRARSHKAKLLSTLMLNGPSTVCYDGEYFFDTDHAEGDSGTQDNDISIDISALPAAVEGSPTVPSTEELAICIMRGIQQMSGFKDDQGEPLNEDMREVLVMLPTPLYGLGAQAVASQSFGSAGNQNPLTALGLSIQVVGNPRLTWTDSFAVFRADRDNGAAPFIHQVEKPVDVMAIAEGSEYEQLNQRQLYGVDWTGALGYGMWQHACYVTMT